MQACLQVNSSRKTKANCGSEVRAGQGRRLRLLPVREVARNCSFRCEKSFMRFRVSFSKMTTRRGRQILSSPIGFSLFITWNILVRYGESVNFLRICWGKTEPGHIDRAHFVSHNYRSIAVPAILIAVLETFAIVAPVEFAIAEFRTVIGRRIPIIA